MQFFLSNNQSTKWHIPQSNVKRSVLAIVLRNHVWFLILIEYISYISLGTGSLQCLDVIMIQKMS